MAEQWLSIVEYARTYQVSDMTVRRRIKTGKLHAVLKEGKYFIPVQAGEAARAGAMEADEDNEVRPAPQRENRYDDRQARRPAGEMQVIKAHPAAQRTLSPATQSYGAPASTLSTPHRPSYPQHQPAHYDNGDKTDGVIPSNLRRPLAGQDTSLVDTRALLAFCEATMRKMNDLERRQVERFKSKLEALEATVGKKDLEIQNLRQQVEDLQLLASTLERRLR
jgi:hypothetical protein